MGVKGSKLPIASSKAINLGDVFPDFNAQSTHGEIHWHDFIKNSWAILFSHPGDYTPVCTTELGLVAKLKDEFEKRGVKIAALSCNDVETHKAWIKDIIASQHLSGDDLPYPIIADPDRKLAVKLNMIDPEEISAQGLPLTARAVFVIGPDGKLKLSILYPATTGRNFDEILRAIDSLQLTATKKVATPANWNHGEECVILPSIPNDEAKELFSKGFRTIEVPSKKAYLRYTPDPSA